MKEKLFKVTKTSELKIISSSNSPIGCPIYRTSDSDCWVETKRIPCDVSETYQCYGWFRHDGTGDPKTYYVTVYQYDSQQNIISGDGSYYYYYQNGGLKDNEWHKIKFKIGPDQNKNHNLKAKYISFGIGVNYQGGNSGYEFCGFQIKRIID